MPVTRREEQMLALADQGLGANAIARRMQIKPESVRRTLSLLTVSRVEDRKREALIRAGSKQLLAAQWAANQFSSRCYITGVRN